MVGVNEAKCEERATLMDFWLLLWLHVGGSTIINLYT